MSLQTLHSDQLTLSNRIGYNMNAAGINGLLTNTTVTNADTNAGLIAAVNAANVHSDILPFKPRIVAAILAGLADTTLTDAIILPLTTVAGLVAATNAGTSTNADLFNQ